MKSVEGVNFTIIIFLIPTHAHFYTLQKHQFTLILKTFKNTFKTCPNMGQTFKVFLSVLSINVNWCFLECVKVCVSWNKKNNRNNMHGTTIKKVNFTVTYMGSSPDEFAQCVMQFQYFV